MESEDIVTREPLNAETSWSALAEPLTPVAGFYKRNNFAIPLIAPDAWRLDFEGFGRPLSLTLRELRARASVEVAAVLECAGSSRTFYEPRPEGTPWGERAVGCARFRGVPLAPLLDEAGVPPEAVELVFQGADTGAFERSLPLDAARAGDTLLAWEMNGAPLAAEHGAPVRLVVPSWYGVASVKWLTRIRPTATPFRGHFQAERYVFEPMGVPVREKRVNSIIATPRPGARVPAGAPLVVRGWAWSGLAPIARVDVSTDGGATWREAELGAPTTRHAWRAWSHTFTPASGEVVLLARAHDERGERQPDRAEWNVHGYGYNAPRPRVVSAS